MITSDELKVGQEVRVQDDDHSRGWIVETDDTAARVELNQGGERWVPLEDLERLERRKQRRTA